MTTTQLLSFIPGFLKSQLLTSIPSPTTSFANQTVIVTGSNTGLGLEATRHIVRLGAAKCILAVRTTSKGDAAAANIISSCDVLKSRVEVWELDMADPESIKAFAKRATKELDRLDAAVLNAGVLTSKYHAATSTGIEDTLAVNTLGTVLLTILLLPKMQASAARTGSRGRLSIVGSDIMYFADLSETETQGSIIDRLNDPAQAQMGKRYGLSKVLVFCCMQEIARRNPVEKSNVLINVLTPGACKSDIFRDEAGALSKMIMSVAQALIARSTEVGSRTLVHGVIPDLSVTTHGRFLVDCRVAANGSNVDSAKGQELAERWNRELFAWLEKTSPGCTKF